MTFIPSTYHCVRSISILYKFCMAMTFIPHPRIICGPWVGGAAGFGTHLECYGEWCHA